MARTGRKRKQGKRTKSGQFSRADRRDNGTPVAQMRKTMFGTHGSTPLGRAYAAGLLGEESEAKERLDAGNKFILRYSKIIGGSRYRCALDRSVRGGSVTHDHDRDRHQQEWLMRAIELLDRSGARPWFDQLIIAEYADHGPIWLDALLEQRWIKHSQRWAEGEPKGKRGDLLILNAAIKALDLIAGTSDGGVVIPFSRNTAARMA